MVVKFPPCLVISLRELDKPEPEMSMMPLTGYDETLELSQFMNSDSLEKGQKVEYELSAVISKPIGKMKKNLTYTPLVKTSIQQSMVWVKLNTNSQQIINIDEVLQHPAEMLFYQLKK